MAQVYNSSQGKIYIPGAIPSIKALTSSAGISTSGVMFLIGESEKGPAFSQETEDYRDSILYGPDQETVIRAKYGSGPLVDAYINAIVPSQDLDIVGAPTGFYMVKTNAGAKASGDILKGTDPYTSLKSAAYGASGNNIQFKIEVSTVEVTPTCTFTFIPPSSAIAGADSVVTVNGTSTLLGVGQRELPSTFESNIEAVAGVISSGGVNRTTLSGNAAGVDTLTIGGISGNSMTITCSATLSNPPTAGDVLLISGSAGHYGSVAASVIKGASNENAGAYVVTAVGTTTITALKVRDSSGGSVTAPVVASAAISANKDDIICYSPVTVKLDESTSWSPAKTSDGYGQTLEFYGFKDATTTNIFYQFNGTTWVPTTTLVAAALGDHKTQVSSVEPKVKISASDSTINPTSTEEIVAGGTVVFSIGYADSLGDSASHKMTITNTGITTDTSQALSVSFVNYPTVGSLVDYINSKNKFSAYATAAMRSMALVDKNGVCVLDKGTFEIGSPTRGRVCRIKKDAYALWQELSTSSLLSLDSAPDYNTTFKAGLPDVVSSLTFLSGGAKGSTSNSNISAALSAIEALKGNFVVTLFSRDAIDDSSEGLTDGSSSYTIDVLNGYLKDHVLKMSTMKKKKYRLGFASKQTSFNSAKEACSELSVAGEMAFAFLDCKAVNSSGIVYQFQPWMSAVKAAAMQAAGFYRGITAKRINCSGTLMADGSWHDNIDSEVEEAILAGMLASRREDDGGYRWVVDQTTYITDDNFVYNSIQAMYNAHLITNTISENMENSFKGKSLADVSAQGGVIRMEQILATLYKNKLIASSDDAPEGYKGLRVRISGNTMTVDVEVKEATTLLFIPINISISPIQQNA